MGRTQRAAVLGRAADLNITPYVAAILVVALYYLAYRYVLQYNSEETSPTYSDTPMPFQIGKYVLLGVVLFAFVVAIVRRERTVRRSERGTTGTSELVSLAFALTILVALTKGLLTGQVRLLEIAMIASVGLVTLAGSRVGVVNSERLSRIFGFFVAVVIVYEAIQLLLFFLVGRLPALAYGGAFSNRFGSVWDDPNGMGMMLAMLIPFTWVGLSRRRLRRVFVVALLVGVLVLTQSFTAIGTVAATLGLAVVLLSRSPSTLAVRWFAFMAFVLVAGLVVTSSDVVQTVFDSKQGSIGARASQLDAGLPTVADLLGIGTDPRFVESSYVSLIKAIGLVPAVGYFAAGVVAVVRLRRLVLEDGRAIFVGMFMFVLGYLIGSVNLRLESIYPINLLYVLFIALAMAPRWSPPLADSRRGESQRLGKRRSVGRW